jgi:hypothetical protein
VSTTHTEYGRWEEIEREHSAREAASEERERGYSYRTFKPVQKHFTDSMINAVLQNI